MCDVGVACSVVESIGAPDVCCCVALSLTSCRVALAFTRNRDTVAA